MLAAYYQTYMNNLLLIGTFVVHPSNDGGVPAWMGFSFPAKRAATPPSKDAPKGW
jgi:hypothetical protein